MFIKMNLLKLALNTTQVMEVFKDLPSAIRVMRNRYAGCAV